MLFGHVGDYRIRLIEKGTQDGRHPILEFTDTRKASAGPGVHRIVYKTHDKRLKEKPESP